MTRYLFGLLCVCALGTVSLIGCGQSLGPMGGSGGLAGDGGNGGSAGGGGSGGSGWLGKSCRGLGGTDITPRCESVEDCYDGEECTTDTCTDGVCEHVAVEDSTPCGALDISDESICVRGSCMLRCEIDADCEADLKDCTGAICASNGYCDLPPVQDGTECDGGICQSGECELSGTVLPCTEQGIRNAIAAGGGPYTFDCDGPTTAMTQAEIVIDNDVSLDGEGNLTVDGSEVRRGDSVFSLPRWAKAELCGVVVTGAKGEAGIGSSGVLTVRNSAVSGNAYGGIRNEGSMIMTGVTVSENTCPQGDCAGGIDNHGKLTMTNCTLSGNQAGPESQTGAVRNDGTMTMVSSTVSGNTYTPGEEKGDIFSWGDGTTTVTNSLIDADCFTEGNATVVSNGYNIESPGDTCGFDQSTDMPGMSADDLKLGELGDNGGPTETHALDEGSVAIDVIPAEDCVDADDEPLMTDQRGEPRPETGGDACDVGAFERQGAIKPGLWRGGDPASNIDGEPFDTGWAICFHVNKDGDGLALDNNCNIDGPEFGDLSFLQISWREDVGMDANGDPWECGARVEVSRNSGSGDGNFISEVPIVDNSFELEFEERGDTNWEISGTFDGDTASGTARVWAFLGMGGFFCELAGGWTATAPIGGGHGGAGGVGGAGGDGG